MIKFSRRAFVTTKKLERLIAAAPNIGLRVSPAKANAPAATGIQIALYMSAQKRFCFIETIVAPERLIALAASQSEFF